ncbi:MAG: hypothetical protein MUE34_01585 [Acidimicrobiales bacterium]|nr:hypothetical protein [Acidimicrobiales bacterium]
MPPGGLRALLTLFVLGYLPGAAVLVAVARGRVRRWDTVLGLAPVVSIGLLFSVVEVLEVTGIGVRMELAIPATFAVAVAVTVLGLRRNPLPRPDRAAVRRVGLEALPVVLLALLAAGIWTTARDGAAVLPNYDAINHGTFVQRISELDTIESREIVIQDVVTGEPAATYYPLAVHVLAAAVVEAGDVLVPDVLFLLVAVVATVMWTVGSHSLARQLLPWRWSGVVAAALSMVLLQFPYKPVSWGGVAIILGAAALPGLLALGMSALRDEPLGNLALFGFCCGSLFAMHNSQLPALAVLLLTLGAPAVYVWGHWRRITVRTWVTTVAVFLAPFWFTIGALSGGFTEREDVAKPTYDLLALFVGQVVTLSVNLDEVYLLPLVLLIGGVGAAFAVRAGRSAVLAWSVFALLVLSAGFDAWWAKPFKVVVSPWYGQFERVSYYLVVPVVVLGTVLVCAASLAAGRELTALAERRRSLPAGTAHRVALVTGGVLVGLALLSGAVAGHGYLQRQFASGDVIRPESLRLADTVPEIAEGTVIASGGSGAMWLYNADPRIRVFGGINLGITDAAQVAWDEHLLLLGLLPEAGRDPTVDALLEAYDVRWVFVNRVGVVGAEPIPTPEALAANPCFALVAEYGTNQLWSVCRTD